MDNLEKLAQINQQLGDIAIDERTFGQIIDMLPSGLILIDRSHRIQLVNREVEYMFGYSRTALIGQPVHVLVDPAIATRHVDHIARFFRHPAIRPMNSGRVLQGRTSSGEIIDVAISIGPLVTEDGILAMAVVRRAGDADAK